jgi:hypothetical protein
MEGQSRRNWNIALSVERENRPGKSFREQRVRAGIRANLADNFNVIYQEDGLTSPAISCHCTNIQLTQPFWIAGHGRKRILCHHILMCRIFTPWEMQLRGFNNRGAFVFFC